METETIILSEVSQRKTDIIWYHSYVETNFLKKWYKWTYLQNRNRLTDIENKSMVTEGERGVEGINEALGLTHTHYNV